VKLEVVKIGGTSCTSLEALRRFFARLDDANKSPLPAPTRDGRAQQVEAELTKIGL
jgi:hypothetical protein